jgi:branched-chain amino acid transport system permease protein
MTGDPSSSGEAHVRPPRLRSSLVRASIPIAVAGAILALVPLRYGDSRTTMGVAITGLLFAAYTIGFNVLFGSTGQLFLCVGALAGLGGYTAAILSEQHGFPIVLCIVMAGIASGLVGGLLSWVAVRRSLGVIFTGIVTFAFSLAFENLLLGRRDITGGETGLVVDAGSATFLGDSVPAYYLFLGLVLGYLALYLVLTRSFVGWAFRGLRDDEISAELAGIDVARYRVAAAVIGSTMIGVAGALFAFAEGFISPPTYSFGRVDVRVLVMLVFGGTGTLLGPVVGAAVFTILDEWLVSYAQLRVVLYGVAILLLFLGFKRGVVPAAESFVGRMRRPRQSRRERDREAEVAAGDQALG